MAGELHWELTWYEHIGGTGRHLLDHHVLGPHAPSIFLIHGMISGCS